MPLLEGASVAIGCEDEIIDRHSHAIVLGRVVHIAASEANAALGYWRYVAIERGSDLSRIADIESPTVRGLVD